MMSYQLADGATTVSSCARPGLVALHVARSSRFCSRPEGGRVTTGHRFRACRTSRSRWRRYEEALAAAWPGDRPFDARRAEPSACCGGGCRTRRLARPRAMSPRLLDRSHALASTRAFTSASSSRNFLWPSGIWYSDAHQAEIFPAVRCRRKADNDTYCQHIRPADPKNMSTAHQWW